MSNVPAKTYYDTELMPSHVVKGLLQKQLKLINEIYDRAEAVVQRSPEGRLRISHSGKKTQFYVCSKPNENGRYIPGSQRKMAETLAFKDYNEDVLRLMQKEKDTLEQAIEGMPERDMFNLLDSIKMERRALFTPYVRTTEEYAAYWLNELYPAGCYKQVNSDIFTRKKEQVRSKSEKIIADLFNDLGIPYRYEFPLKLRNGAQLHPDFTVLNIKTRKTYYWEHLGMMSKDSYALDAVNRLELYEANGIFPGEKLILSYEADGRSINTKNIDLLINRYLL